MSLGVGRLAVDLHGVTRVERMTLGTVAVRHPPLRHVGWTPRRVASRRGGTLDPLRYAACWMDSTPGRVATGTPAASARPTRAARLEAFQVSRLLDAHLPRQPTQAKASATDYFGTYCLVNIAKQGQVMESTIFVHETVPLSSIYDSVMQRVAVLQEHDMQYGNAQMGYPHRVILFSIPLRWDGVE